MLLDRVRAIMSADNINWFPGHMAKTRRQIKENLKLVDAVAELLDARIPESSRNPELSGIINGKPKIVILNKCDLADETVNSEWVNFYRSGGAGTLQADCRTGKGLNVFRPAVNKLLKDAIEKNKSRGMAGKPLRVMVVGIPNTGKSSFINRLAGTGKAKTEDRAGVTRSLQWYNIGGGIELLDTPGVLWPKLGDPAVGDRLAFTGGIKESVIDAEALAVRLIAVLMKDYPENLAGRYKITDFENKEPYEVLEMAARKRGMAVRGGEADTERMAITLLDEFKGGKLGRISLEKPKQDADL